MLIEEALKSTNPEVLVQEVVEREKLINMLVGALYPQIVRAEIIRIKERYTELTGRYM